MPKPIEPTPAEIAAMTAVIREGWSEAEHWRRAGYEDRAREWRTPVIAIEWGVREPLE